MANREINGYEEGSCISCSGVDCVRGLKLPGYKLRDGEFGRLVFSSLIAAASSRTGEQWMIKSSPTRAKGANTCKRHWLISLPGIE
jgi:hypothetical protein